MNDSGATRAELMSDPRGFNLTLRDAGDAVPVDVRLRGALKVLLRRFALRCTSITHEPPSATEGSETPGSPRRAAAPQPPADAGTRGQK